MRIPFKTLEKPNDIRVLPTEFVTGAVAADHQISFFNQAARYSLLIALFRRAQPYSATRSLFKVESGINGILPAGGGPLPFIPFLA